MTILSMTWNQNLDSLGDVSQEAFADAFEDEVHADERFRECNVTVTFEPALYSKIMALNIDDDDCPDFVPWQHVVSEKSQAAWEKYLSQGRNANT